jgi:hypothetical protein
MIVKTNSIFPLNKTDQWLCNGDAVFSVEENRIFLEPLGELQNSADPFVHLHHILQALIVKLKIK